MPKNLVFLVIELAENHLHCEGDRMSDCKARGSGSWLNFFSVMSVITQSKSSPCSGTYLIISMAVLILVLPSMGLMGMASKECSGSV